jgi:indolepyruvate ferredoxin oxidoreductase alpha subunit
VIISRRACVLLERREMACYRVDEEECTGCKRCLRLGCPAVVMRGEIAYIDEDQCAGCSMCAQICNPGAMREVGEDD